MHRCALPPRRILPLPHRLPLPPNAGVIAAGGQPWASSVSTQMIVASSVCRRWKSVPARAPNVLAQTVQR
ncbi:MAG: hypothetical protein M3Y58_02520 [Chloroflexota bacterium]|nr:hypothetical protein [Chloroflexota bacterium]